MDKYHGFPAQHATGKLLMRLSSSLRGRIIFGIVMGAATGLVSFALHEIGMSHLYYRHGGLIVSSGISLFVAVVSYMQMDAVRLRRDLVFQQVKSAAELNHHVRNALQVIHYAAHLGTDDTNLGMIEENIQRIDEALREIYPVADDPRKSTRQSA